MSAVSLAEPAVFLIHVERPALSRWVLWLVEALEKRPGSEVHVRLVDPAPGESSALDTLLSLERMVLRRHGASGADRLPPSALADRPPVPDRLSPDLVINLTRQGVPSFPASCLRPLYNGHPGETALAAALFFQGTPAIAIERSGAREEARIVAAGTASLEAASGIGGGIEAVGSRVIALILKSLSPAADAVLRDQKITAPFRSIGRADIARDMAKNVARAAVRAAYRLCCHGSHWRVGYRFVEPGGDVWSRRDLAGARWSVLADPVDHFYADPFPFHWQGRDYLFFEDLHHRTEKGIISVVAFDEAGRPGPVMPVLEEPWHLSYPFLIEHEGELYMIPESSNNFDIPIYRCTGFPLKWERHAVLVDDVEAADATIIRHGGLYWMTAVVRDGAGGYSDMLALWSSENLFGPWQPHPANPVLVDDRTARPAGNMVSRDGNLYRPVQDCRRTYGAALSFMRVKQLDGDGFAQQSEGTVTAGGAWPGSRIHTLNYNGRFEAIDGYTLRPRLKPAADFVDWWYRPPEALGIGPAPG
ncbi:MAG: hypothetical protein KJ796_07375 [Alphaproteobacteria bacterium]|nr:hypothetical protein [Alphaproteobacteria bacterium]